MIFIVFDSTSLFTENPLFLENPFLPQFIGVFMSSAVRHVTAYSVCLYYFHTFPGMSSARLRPDNTKIMQCHLQFNNKKVLTLFWKLNLLLMQAKFAVGASEGVLFLHCFVNPGRLRTCIPLLLPQGNVFIGDQRVVQLPRLVSYTSTDRNL